MTTSTPREGVVVEAHSFGAAALKFGIGLPIELSAVNLIKHPIVPPICETRVPLRSSVELPPELVVKVSVGNDAFCGNGTLLVAEVVAVIVGIELAIAETSGAEFSEKFGTRGISEIVGIELVGVVIDTRERTSVAVVVVEPSACAATLLAPTKIEMAVIPETQTHTLRACILFDLIRVLLFTANAVIISRNACRLNDDPLFF
jgi:hypothetical protein